MLHRFDLVFFTIAAFISLDTIALTAAYGAGETFVWLAFLIIVYLIPYGMIIAEMGSAFPVEGGPYAWVRMAFGRLAGSLHRGHLLGLQPGVDRRHAGGDLRGGHQQPDPQGPDEHRLVHRRRPRRRLGRPSCCP